jgi:enoyl-CoA hydratase
MSVRVERDGHVTTVILDRPAARNAVNRTTAAALAEAFRKFDADGSGNVAVLWGAGTRSRAGWNSHCGATFGWPKRTRYSACSAAAGGPTDRRRHRQAA